MGISKSSILSRMCAVLASLCIAMTLGVAVANADETEYPDIMLGVFMNSQNDSTDSFYVSQDGVYFEKISEAFKNLYPNDPWNAKAVGSQKDGRSWDLYSFNCPSIIWHDGYFWMLANEANGGNNGTLRLVISYSKDLVHWSDQYPTQVKVPSGVPSNKESTKFDAVAADWAVMPNGKIAVAVSMGYYGDFHGKPEKDTMTPYLVIIDSLSTTGDPAVNPRLNRYDIKVGSAVKINLPVADKNRIDGSWYFEGDKAYLSIKRNGVINEIYSTDAKLSNVGKASNWKLVNRNVITGFEAPCLTKLNGKYYFFTDELATWTPDNHKRGAYLRTGTHVNIAKSMTALSTKNTEATTSSSATGPFRIQAKDASGKNYTVATKKNVNGDGPRHGTVITITDPVAKKIIYEQRAKAGWKTPAGSAKPVNKISGVTASKTFKASVVKKKAQTFKIGAKAKDNSKVTYKAVSYEKSGKITADKAKKYISVASSGTVTVKKGAPKGTYKVKTKISTAANVLYRAKSLSKVITVNVK